VVTRSYEGFLSLPVPLVLSVLWLAGVTLGAACVATVYEVGSVLTQALTR
jgi:hypothetical protein